MLVWRLSPPMSPKIEQKLLKRVCCQIGYCFFLYIILLKFSKFLHTECFLGPPHFNLTSSVSVNSHFLITVQNEETVTWKRSLSPWNPSPALGIRYFNLQSDWQLPVVFFSSTLCGTEQVVGRIFFFFSCLVFHGLD